MNSKKAFRQFMLHVATAPAGAYFETGVLFDERKGWRVYQRLDTKALVMNPDDARGLATTFDKCAVSPEWRGNPAAEELRGHFTMLRTLADEADSNNRNKIRPPDAPLVSSMVGHA
jgi:hypothetical protein